MRTKFTPLVSAVALLLSLASVAQPAAAESPWQPYDFSASCGQTWVDDQKVYVAEHGTFLLEEKPWGFLFSQKSEHTVKLYAIGDVDCIGDPIQTVSASLHVVERHVDSLFNVQQGVTLIRGTLTLADGSTCTIRTRVIIVNGEIQRTVDPCGIT